MSADGDVPSPAEIVAPAFPEARVVPIQPPKGMQVSVDFSVTSGPLPPPQVIAQYEKILPGSAARLFTMAEEQGRHRIQLERMVVETGTNEARIGMRLGAVLGVGVLAVGAYAIYKGQATAGATVVTGTIVSLAGVFYKVATTSRVEMDRKNRSNPGPSPATTPAAPLPSSAP